MQINQRVCPQKVRGPNRVYEPKWNGLRALLRRRGANVRMCPATGVASSLGSRACRCGALVAPPALFAGRARSLGLRDGKPGLPALLGRLAGRAVLSRGRGRDSGGNAVLEPLTVGLSWGFSPVQHLRERVATGKAQLSYMAKTGSLESRAEPMSSLCYPQFARRGMAL